MRRLNCLVLVIIAATLGTTSQAGDGKKAKKDEERILGTWAMVSGEKSGEKAPDKLVQEFRLTFAKEGKLQVKAENEKEGTYKLNTSKKPREIDFTVDGKNLPGIYVFEGKNLKLCVGHDERPTAFVSEAGTKTMLLVLKRATP